MFLKVHEYYTPSIFPDFTEFEASYVHGHDHDDLNANYDHVINYDDDPLHYYDHFLYDHQHDAYEYFFVMAIFMICYCYAKRGCF